MPLADFAAADKLTLNRAIGARISTTYYYVEPIGCSLLRSTYGSQSLIKLESECWQSCGHFKSILLEHQFYKQLKEDINLIPKDTIVAAVLHIFLLPLFSCLFRRLDPLFSIFFDSLPLLPQYEWLAPGGWRKLLLGQASKLHYFVSGRLPTYFGDLRCLRDRSHHASI